MSVSKLHVHLFNKKLHVFQFWGILGFIFGVIVGITLTIEQTLPLWVLGTMSLCGAATFFAHVYIQKIITGREELVYYRHEIAILVVNLLVLWLINQPVLSFLDITLLGVGTFLAFGRVGCYNVGCCHGRPCTKGVKYTQEHVDEGFPNYYIGIKIFPLPLVESFFVAITVVIGVWLFLSSLPKGTVLIWYTVFYGTVRFILEFFRGDPERPYFLGLSEAQWTTWLLIILSVIGSLTGGLPYYLGQMIIAVIISMASIIIIVFNKNWKIYRLLNSAHIHQLAEGLYNLTPTKSSENSPVKIHRTNLGMSYSYGKIVVPDGTMEHFTFSNNEPNLVLDTNSVKQMVKYIKTIQKINVKPNIIEKASGVFQVTFWQPNSTDA